MPEESFLIALLKHKYYDSQHIKRTLMHFADNVEPDHHAYLCSLIWALYVHRHILQYPHSVSGQ